MIEVGKVVLTENPTDHFAQVEQVAFDVANMPPGIDPSLDPVLQGRMFTYGDAQRHR